MQSRLNLYMRHSSWVVLTSWLNCTFRAQAEKNPTIPRERISRIVWNPRPESPFYDPSGNMVKPFAKLRIQKQRSYERTCDEDARRAGPNYSQDWDEDEDSFEDRRTYIYFYIFLCFSFQSYAVVANWSPKCVHVFL